MHITTLLPQVRGFYRHSVVVEPPPYFADDSASPAYRSLPALPPM